MASEAGDSVSGVTIMQMDAGLDTGAMLYEVRTPITLAPPVATSTTDWPFKGPMR